MKVIFATLVLNCLASISAIAAAAVDRSTEIKCEGGAVGIWNWVYNIQDEANPYSDCHLDDDTVFAEGTLYIIIICFAFLISRFIDMESMSKITILKSGRGNLFLTSQIFN